MTAARRGASSAAPGGRFAALAEQVEGDLAIVRERAQSAETRAALEAALALFARWRRAAEQADDGAPIAALSAEMREALDVVVNHIAGDAFRAERAARAQVGVIREAGAAATAIGLILGALVAWLLGRRILGPVAAASAAARGIAAGRLDTPIPAAGGDELGALLRAMATMRDNIRAMMEREVAARRSAQGRLVDAIEGSREGVMLVDGDGRIVIANRQVAAFLPRRRRCSPRERPPRRWRAPPGSTSPPRRRNSGPRTGAGCAWRAARCTTAGSCSCSPTSPP